MMRFFIILAFALAGYLIYKVSLLRVKEGVSLENVSWRMFYAAIVWEGITKRYSSEAVITSGADGIHRAPRSKHYAENNASGMVEALDFRTWDLPIETAAHELREILGPDYDVVIESDHLHVEYDPKGYA